jgi:uracil-DNA glycosylase family 4
VARPIDLLLQFLKSEQAEGVTHIHLDDGARDGLRELFLRSRAGAARPAAGPAAAAPDLATAAPQVAVPAPSSGPKPDRLEALRRQAEHWAPARALGTLRDKLVFAGGNPDGRLMLVGEAPGYDDERAGQPFAGSAGQKLTDILKAMGLSRDDVYFSYLVKFRPAMARQTTNNRRPSADEMAACLPFIRAEVGIVQPQCVVAFGATAAEGLSGLDGGVPELRGQWHEFEGTPLRVTYPPGMLLQSNGGTEIKRMLWEDMLAVMEKLGLPISEKQRGYFLPKA